MQKWIIETALIWQLEIKLGNRRDESMNSWRDRAWPPIRNSYVPCHRFAIRTCLATDLRFQRPSPPICDNMLPLLEAPIVYMVYSRFTSGGSSLSSDQLYGKEDSFRISKSISRAGPLINVSLIGFFEHNSTFGTW